MAGVYTVPYTGTLTNAGGDADLFEITPGDDKPVGLMGLLLGQTSEVADAAEEAIRVTIYRLPATVTSGNGTSVTPVAIDSAQSAAGFAAESNGATVATTSGSAAILAEFAWNIRSSPLEMWWPDDNAMFKVRQTEALIVRCQTTVADDVTICITAYVKEF